MNKDLNDNTSRSFTSMIVLLDAINRAASTDPEGIRKALLATDMKPDQMIMPWKDVTFDHPVAGAQIKIVWPFDLASADVLYPLPKWSDRK